MAEEKQQQDKTGVDVQKSGPIEPHPGMQIMSLLEDVGLVNIARRESTFEQAMFELSFPYLPDVAFHAIALACGAYALMQLGVF